MYSLLPGEILISLSVFFTDFPRQVPRESPPVTDDLIKANVVPTSHTPSYGHLQAPTIFKLQL